MWPRHLILVASLTMLPICGLAAEATAGCPQQEVDAHVRNQFAQFGPLSVDHEYFGFIYVHEGVIQSSVTRGGKCHEGNCLTNTATAVARIPRGAKVLGEWHTHPHDGSTQLSVEDIRGAQNNAHIRCYVAYYGKPDGEILSWDPRSTSVPTAMASRISIGNYAPRLANQTKERADSQL